MCNNNNNENNNICIHTYISTCSSRAATGLKLWGPDAGPTAASSGYNRDAPSSESTPTQTSPTL